MKWQCFVVMLWTCSVFILTCATDHSDAVSEKNYQSTDSDNEEFCDSMEHLAMEEVSIIQSRMCRMKHLFTMFLPITYFFFLSPQRKVESPEASSVKPRELWFESSTTLNGQEDQVLIEISKSQHNSSLSRGGRGETTLTKLLKGSDMLLACCSFNLSRADFSFRISITKSCLWAVC